MKFNEKLVNLRKKHNLSQEQVAEKLGVARQTISKWELGETTPEMRARQGETYRYRRCLQHGR